jgi:predicted Zn-dependent peptidase
LPADDLEAVRSLAIQDIKGLEDEPSSLVMTQLRKCHYPVPFSNDHRGTESTVNALTLDAIREYYSTRFRPRGAIVSIAGNIEWEPLQKKVGELFGDWEGQASGEVAVGPTPERRGHITKDLEQTYITVAYNSVPFGHPLYYQAMGAVNVLSGNMSSRLFTEIREKHGLCYSVHASYSTLRDRGGIFCFAASLNHDAPRTLELLIHELKRLQEGIAQDEVDRVQAGLKSSQIMQQESTSARALALASDWFYLGRVRSFDEIRAGIESLTPESIVDYVRQYPAQDFTIVTLGPKPIQ